MFSMRLLLSALVLFLVAANSSASLARQESGLPDPSPPETACRSAEVCYLAAMAPEDDALLPEDRVRTKIKRLRVVPLLEPESVWARRALLLVGVLSTEADPTEALRQLEAVQPDVPILDDYVRLWRGEALLKLGDASEAAVLF